jgi:hypothetical protein
MGGRERRSKKAPRNVRLISDSRRREGWSAACASDPPRSRLRCPIYNCVYKGLSLTDRIWSGGANADRNRFALSYGPFPTAQKAHFDDRETDAAMFHGGPPLTFKYALIEATAFASAGPAQLPNGLIQFRDVIWGGRVSPAKINADPLTLNQGGNFGPNCGAQR